MSEATISLSMNGELLASQTVKDYEPLTDAVYIYVPGMESDEFTDHDRWLVFWGVKTKEEILAEKGKKVTFAIVDADDNSIHVIEMSAEDYRAAVTGKGEENV
jgi:hypothetical protein